MFRVVDSKKSLILFFILLIFSLSFSSAQDVEIFNVYSLGDKVAFVVVNTTTHKPYALIYQNGSFVEKYPLNFSLEYMPIHWNGKYWLLQKGVRGTVELCIYNGTFKHIKTFNNGSLCTDNDLEVKWNGREYFLTFLGAGPHDDPMHGISDFILKNYILKDEKLIPINASGEPYWIQPLNAWLVGEYLVDEDGKITHINITVNARIYNKGIAYNDTHVWLIIVWSSDRFTNVTIYELNGSTPVEVYSTKVRGGASPPDIWRGNPILIGCIETPKSYNHSILLFNGSSLLKIHDWGNTYTLIHPISVGKRIFVLCLYNRFAPDTSDLFEIKNGKAKLLNTFTVGYVYVYDVNDYRGFPAFTLWTSSSLILYTNNSIFLFNPTYVQNLLTTNERIYLPEGLRWKEYNVTYCCDGWIVFTKNEVYILKDNKFENLTPKLREFLIANETNTTIPTPLHPSSVENSKSNNHTTVTVLIAIALILMFILLGFNLVKRK